MRLFPPLTHGPRRYGTHRSCPQHQSWLSLNNSCHCSFNVLNSKTSLLSVLQKPSERRVPSLERKASSLLGALTWPLALTADKTPFATWLLLLCSAAEESDRRQLISLGGDFWPQTAGFSRVAVPPTEILTWCAQNDSPGVLCNWTEEQDEESPAEKVSSQTSNLSSVATS